MKKWILSLTGAILLTSIASAQPAQTIIKIEATTEADTDIMSSELPDIYKNKIMKGKKTNLTLTQKSSTQPEANNTRQTFQETSGALVADVNNQSYYSISLRGLGDSHESENVLMMSDDIPVSADFYGYPAAYYLPSLSSVEAVEVVKTGAGLLYGTQPGGSINFRLKQGTYNTQAKLETVNTLGTNQLFSTFNSITGGLQKLAYRIEAYQKQGDGSFKDNSDFKAFGFDTRLRYKINEQQELRNQISFYQGRFNEAGGLALNPAAGRVSIAEDRKQNTLSNDELLIDRIEARLGHHYQVSDQLNMTSTVWANNMSRESRRQNGGGFGLIPTTNTNSIQDQDFYTGGGRINLAQDYQFNERLQTLTANFTYYKMTSPIEIGTGATADADDWSTLNRQLTRKTDALSLAVENQFNTGAWAITPAVRTENITQKIEETFNGTGSLRNTDTTDNVVLGGLAVSYAQNDSTQIYANVSEGFKPILYSQAVPTSSNTIINDDIRSSRTLSTEIGVKGLLNNAITYDASIFTVDHQDQVGTVTGSATTNLGNVGDARYEGLDLSLRGQVTEQISTFANSQFLKARYVAGPQDTKTPASAPHYIHKIGIQHETDLLKNRLSATFLKEHYSDDNNTTERKIPSYSVWDYAGELNTQMNFFGTNTQLTFGVNNVFDAQYYSRVRATGIEPALERNYYAGFKLNY